MNSNSFGTICGYARTSTDDQVAGLSDQIAELERAGCQRIFHEQISSVSSRRPELTAAIDWLRQGDTFIVTKPDRLARNVSDLLRIISALKTKGVSVRILNMGVDTESPTGMLMLQMLAAVGQWERSEMLSRQKAGIRKAKMEGKYKGRIPTAMRQSDKVRNLHSSGMKVSEIVKSVNISRASVYRIISLN
jgi:DNA invertase Pin-like site-specific DNA recombinase